MAGALYTVQELNTIITMLGCLCATVQMATGLYATRYHKKTSILKTNDVLNRAHRGFGGFATTLYFLGLFAGLSGFIGALFGAEGSPPLEFSDVSFNVHTWMSFPIMVVLIWKTYISYLKKKSIYKKGKWLGIATYIAWAYTWITAAISYYFRVEPPNIVGTIKPFPPPTFLLQFNLMWLQIILPFVIGIVISIPIIKAAHKIEEEKARKKKEKLNNQND